MTENDNRFFRDLIYSQAHQAKAQAELAKAQAKQVGEETDENDTNDRKVEETILVSADDNTITLQDVKEYNDSIVMAKRGIIRASNALGRWTRGDKARSKKVSRLHVLADEILELLNDKEIECFYKNLH